MIGRTFRFKVRPVRVNPRDESERRFALFIATLVCVGVYYVAGAGGWMLFTALATYVLARMAVMRR